MPSIKLGRSSDYTPSPVRNGGSDGLSPRRPGLDFDNDTLFKDRDGEFIEFYSCHLF